ncbi:MAG: right-handed parallel beta-helix repeat-containing protein [Phycisphaerales bacterium]|nr:right-handed parallel beta-helix repeat-containing protein [Phycisphaerales bacterium]
MKRSCETLRGIFLFALLLPCSTSLGLDLHVAIDGNDAWTGRPAQSNADKSDGPFATIERARDEIRRLKRQGPLPAGGVTVHIHEGDYVLERTFELTAKDTGTAETPITYRAHGDAKVRLLGGRPITNFKPVTDPAILKRLDEAARTKVWAADLKEVGITDYGDPVTPGKRPELFFQDRPMTLARWPNEGFTTIGKVVGGDVFTVHGLTGDRVGKFTYEGDRPVRWVDEPDLRMHGFWFWDWSDGYDQVEAIDLQEKIIRTVPPYHPYGYRNGQRYYVLNALSELDSPGEWYLDRQSGILYFWPPADSHSAQAFVSVLNTIVSMRKVSFVTLRGLGLEFSRGSTLTVHDGTDNKIAGCTLRNIGGSAVMIKGGLRHQVTGCDIDQIGDSGITLEGGDRNTLTPCGHTAVNNHIHNYSRIRRTYRSAVSVVGVGCRVAHNLIHDAPHMALGLIGNDHVFEYNEVYNVCLETDDAGAFYMGRDWTARGNVIRYNYFHHLGPPSTLLHGTQGIYLDDWSSGTTVYGNVCYKMYMGVLVGGGRNNTVENNIFVDCKYAVQVDSRGLGWAKYYFDGTNNTLVERLEAVPYKEPPWSTRYPELLTLYEDEPALAKYNQVVRNIAVDNQQWLRLLDNLADPIVTIENNLVDVDPLFIDAAKQDFRLRPESPAWAKGFKPIPFERIGLYTDEVRKSIPPRRVGMEEQ